MAKKKSAKKPTTALYSKRVQEVYNLLLKGSSRPEIIEYSSKKWGVS